MLLSLNTIGGQVNTPVDPITDSLIDQVPGMMSLHLLSSADAQTPGGEQAFPLRKSQDKAKLLSV